MRRVARIATVVSGSLLLMGANGAVAHAPGVILYGAGTATIDGSLATGEWSGARRLDFAARLPSHDGGGTVAASISAMNDGSSLYASLDVARGTFGGKTFLAMYFDNDHDGTRAAGDDAFLADVGAFPKPRFIDLHWGPCTPGGQGVGCAVPDTERGGTSDGSTAAGIAGVHAVIEVSHALNSSNDAHDFSLGAGSVVGVAAVVRLWTPDIDNCNVGTTCYADTVLPIGLPDGSVTSGYGNLVVSPDAVAPETGLAEGPAEGSTTTAREATFALSGTDNLTPADQLHFSCSLDGAAFSECGARATFTALGDGRHSVQARAADELGSVDATPAARNWFVDVSPPSRPRVRVRVKGRFARIRLSSVDATSGVEGFRCALDRRRLQRCAASFRSRVKPGRHVLRAVAVDRVGHRSLPTTARFRVRATAR